MSFAPMNYGDISPRVGLYAVAKFLAYADSQLCLDKFANSQPLPKNKGLNMKWRRPVPFAVGTTPLTEGVTPAPKAIEYEDVSATILQYGSWVTFTDVIVDTHEDPNLNTMVELCAKEAADVKEALIWNTLRGGTSVIYTGSATSRATVNAVVDLGDFRNAVRELKTAGAKMITKKLSASPNFGTEAVGASYVAFAHTNLERDIRDLPGFVPVERYGSGSPIHEFELGKLENVRVLLTNHLEPFFGAGSTTTTGVMNNGSAVDVYPIVIIGEDAYACTALKGMDSVNVAVKNPKIGESYGDPLGQRGFVAWKMWFVCTRLNEQWMVRIESAASV